MAKYKKAALALLALGLAVWLVSSAVVARKLTQRARPPFAEPAANVNWSKAEEHRLTTSDGQTIGAWLVRHPDPHGCVLVLHGNGSSRSARLGVMQLVWSHGYSVMAISLRCHGDSTGEVNDLGWSARHDVVTAVDFLEQECPQQPVYIVGQSLGSAAAIFAADQLGNRVSGYFLEQPYRDLQSAAWNRLQNALPPVFDCVAYVGLRLWSVVFLSAEVRQHSPFDMVTRIPADVPIVIATGSADRHARLEDVQAVLGQVESHARLVVFRGAEHVSLYKYDPELYAEALLECLNEDVPPDR